MGYVEYNVTQEVMGGIILFPKKLSLVLQIVGDEVWNQFKERNFENWELEKNVENLDDPRHFGAAFLDQKYFWASLHGYGHVWPQMVDQIRATSDEVVETLEYLDKDIDKIRGYCPNPSTDFSRIQTSGLLIG
jgi:hypothetical protein